MINLFKNNIIIICGADACGKSELANKLREKVSGKCHILHSNYNRLLPGQNNFRQHQLMIKFAVEQFDTKHYTGNRLVILDRNYISDIIYGQIGYGSKGTVEQKTKNLTKMLKQLTKNNHVNVSLIYCRPQQTKFEKMQAEREELLRDEKQNLLIQEKYDEYFKDVVPGLCEQYDIELYRYDFTKDPEYKELLGD